MVNSYKYSCKVCFNPIILYWKERLRLNKFAFFLNTIFFLIIFLVVQKGHGQTTLSGKIVDDQGNPITYASLKLYSNKVDTISRVADEYGKFSFDNIIKDRYFLHVYHVQSLDTLIEIFPDNFSNMLLIKASRNRSISLQEVTVVGQKPRIEQLIDRMVFNVNESVLATNDNGWELLNKVPGVTSNGGADEIKLNGRSGVRVLRDGRSIQLSGAELKNYLSSLNSSNIEKVELMTNPPSEFDAEGSAGVINIITKRNKTIGYSGSVIAGATQRTDLGTNFGTTINYNYNSLLISAIYNYQLERFTNSGDLKQQFNSDVNYHQIGRSYNRNQNHLARLSMEYLLDSVNTIGFSVDLNNTDRFRQDAYDMSAYSGQVLDSILNSRNKNYSDNRQVFLNLFYRYYPSSRKYTVDFDVDYGAYKNNFYNPNRTTITKDGEDKPYSEIVFNNITDREIRVFSSKVDISRPLNSIYKFNLGAKFSKMSNVNDVVFNNLADGIPSFDSTRSNRFEYDEAILAFYAKFSGEIGNLGYQVGLRGENTKSKGHSITLNDEVNREYFELFPTLFLNYKKSDAYVLNLNYSRRIGRPQYNFLNPFRFYTNPYIYTVGDPFLKPSFTNAITIKNIIKSKLIISASWSMVNDNITFVSNQDNDQRTLVRTRVNLDKLTSWGANAMYDYDITSWWNIFAYVSLTNSQIKTIASSVLYDESQTNYMFQLSNLLDLKIKEKKIQFEVSSYYNSPVLSGFDRIDQVFDLSLGFKTKVFNDKVRVSVSANDILKTMTFKTTRSFMNQNYNERFYNDNRRVSVSLSYNFGKMKKSIKDREKSSDQERGRIGTL